MIAKLLATFHRNRQHLIFVLSVILSLILIFNNDSEQIKNISLSVNRVISYIKTPFSKFNLQLNALQENELLRENLMLKTLELETMFEYETENSILKEMLNFKREYNVDLVPAKVISMGMTSNLLSMTIDVGTDLGIKKNDPVITPLGIVGKITAADKQSAIVQLISDTDFRIGVRILPSRGTGIMRWQTNNICEVREVYKNSNINVGDRVVTSGLSDIFPAGLPIGIVNSVTDDRNLFQKNVLVSIEENLNSLIFVFVIINKDTYL